MNIFPWADWLFFACHTLHLSPADFWSLSVAEWKAMQEGYMRFTQANMDTPLQLHELDDLMKRYPDDNQH